MFIVVIVFKVYAFTPEDAYELVRQVCIVVKGAGVALFFET